MKCPACNYEWYLPERRTQWLCLQCGRIYPSETKAKQCDCLGTKPNIIAQETLFR